jgi:O-antigen/teichoic acid export membrane protein
MGKEVMMNKEIWFSPTGLILIAVLLFLVLSVLSHLLGATYFTVAAITVGFLILLIIYLVIRIFEPNLLEKIRKSISKNDE